MAEAVTGDRDNCLADLIATLHLDVAPVAQRHRSAGGPMLQRKAQSPSITQTDSRSVEAHLVHVHGHLFRGPERVDLDGLRADAHHDRRVERDAAFPQRLLADLDLEIILRRLQQRELAGLLKIELTSIEVEQMRSPNVPPIAGFPTGPVTGVHSAIAATSGAKTSLRARDWGLSEPPSSTSPGGGALVGGVWSESACADDPLHAGVQVAVIGTEA